MFCLLQCVSEYCDLTTCHPLKRLWCSMLNFIILIIIFIVQQNESVAMARKKQSLSWRNAGFCKTFMLVHPNIMIISLRSSILTMDVYARHICYHFWIAFICVSVAYCVRTSNWDRISKFQNFLSPQMEQFKTQSK